MNPADFIASGGTLAAWIDRGGTLPGAIIGRASTVHAIRYGSIFSPMTESSLTMTAHEHWRKENSDYFQPLHSTAPRSELGEWLFGKRTPYGPFGAGFEADVCE